MLMTSFMIIMNVNVGISDGSDDGTRYDIDSFSSHLTYQKHKHKHQSN